MAAAEAWRRGAGGVGVEPGGAGRGGWEDYSSRRAPWRRGARSGLAGCPCGPVGSRRCGPVPRWASRPSVRSAASLVAPAARAPGSPSVPQLAPPVRPPLWRVSCSRALPYSAPPKQRKAQVRLGCGAGFPGNGRWESLGVRN